MAQRERQETWASLKRDLKSRQALGVTKKQKWFLSNLSLSYTDYHWKTKQSDSQGSDRESRAEQPFVFVQPQYKQNLLYHGNWINFPFYFFLLYQYYKQERWHATLPLDYELFKDRDHLLPNFIPLGPENLAHSRWSIKVLRESINTKVEDAVRCHLESPL